MKFKKGTPDFNKISDKIDNRDKVVISSELFAGEDKPYYICSLCNQTLSKLTDAGQNNATFWCRHCSIEFDPESENLRKESKIIVPDRNIEPAVSTAPGIPDISIHKEPELKGAFKALQEKGLRIKDYKEGAG